MPGPAGTSGSMSVCSQMIRQSRAGNVREVTDPSSLAFGARSRGVHGRENGGVGTLGGDFTADVEHAFRDEKIGRHNHRDAIRLENGSRSERRRTVQRSDVVVRGHHVGLMRRPPHLAQHLQFLLGKRGARHVAPEKPDAGEIFERKVGGGRGRIVTLGGKAGSFLPCRGPIGRQHRGTGRAYPSERPAQRGHPIQSIREGDLVVARSREQMDPLAMPGAHAAEPAPDELFALLRNFRRRPAVLR